MISEILDPFHELDGCERCRADITSLLGLRPLYFRIASRDSLLRRKRQDKYPDRPFQILERAVDFRLQMPAEGRPGNEEENHDAKWYSGRTRPD